MTFSDQTLISRIDKECEKLFDALSSSIWKSPYVTNVNQIIDARSFMATIFNSRWWGQNVFEHYEIQLSEFINEI